MLSVGTSHVSAQFVDLGLAGVLQANANYAKLSFSHNVTQTCGIGIGIF